MYYINEEKWVSWEELSLLLNGIRKNYLDQWVAFKNWYAVNTSYLEDDMNFRINFEVDSVLKRRELFFENYLLLNPFEDFRTLCERLIYADAKNKLYFTFEFSLFFIEDLFCRFDYDCTRRNFYLGV